MRKQELALKGMRLSCILLKNSKIIDPVVKNLFHEQYDGKETDNDKTLSRVVQ